MNLTALMGAMGALGQANPLVKKVVDSLMGTMTANPEAIQEISTVVQKIADLKGLTVDELITGGGLGRAMIEKFVQGEVQKEKRTTELQSMTCEKCGHVDYQMVERYAPVSPIAMLAEVAKAS